MNVGIVTSFIIGGLLLLSVFTLNNTVMQHSAQSTMELSAQTHVETLSEVMSYDIRKMGYRTTGVAVQTATPLQLAFLSDLDNDGTVESVSWIADTTAHIPATHNPDDFLIYRIVNSDTTDFATATTGFEFTYYDSTGAQTAGLTDIKSVQVVLRCESPEPLSNEYVRASWQQRFSPRNL